MSYSIECKQHGNFAYKNSVCPGCVNQAHVEAKKRTEKIREEARLHFSVGQRTQENTLAYLKKYYPDAYREYADEIAAINEQEKRNNLIQQRIAADLEKLNAQYGEVHKMGKPGIFKIREIHGACIVDKKKYARISQGIGIAYTITCIPWIDAFAARIGIDYSGSSALKVCWESKNDLLYVRDEDAIIGD
jgi:hypothetical protein